VTELTSYIIYRKEWAFKWFFSLGLLSGFAFTSDYYLKSRLLTILFLCLILATFILIKPIMRRFTRKAIIQLDNNKISFNILKLATGQQESQLEYSFFDIQSYNIKFPTNRFTCLTLNFNSGNKKEFSFLRRQFNNSQSDTDIVIETVHSTFTQFNILHNATNAIGFKPSFYASKKGLYTIIFLTILLSIEIGISIRLNKYLPSTFSLASILLIGQLISRRMTDLAFYKKMKDD
jgi:hypothetical protein